MKSLYEITAQQAAYLIMSEEQRRETHLRLGLALCVHTMNNTQGDDELFFGAVYQINKAGPALVNEPDQRDIIAHLNLKAGKLALKLSDFGAGFKLFVNGISFLNTSHWDTQYTLSVDLFDAAAESACVINNREAVVSYTGILVANARSYDDKLNCLYTAAKALRHAELLQESMESTFSIFLEMGEKLPCRMGDSKLSADMNAMDEILVNMTDDSICNMTNTNDKRMDTLLSLYANLMHTLHFYDPSFGAAVSLRMVDITLKHGLSSLSSLAFAHYGEILASIGNLDLACRLGMFY